MDKKLKYEDFVRMGIIRRLPEVEKEKYLSFHDKLWKEDFRICKLLIDKSPRWSIISGYYAMHGLAKYLLAKRFNLKISGKFVHAAVIEALKKFLGEDFAKNFKEAEDFVSLEEIPELLDFAKRERAKSQYYSGRALKFSEENAKEFFEEIVKPFVEKVLELC